MPQWNIVLVSYQIEWDRTDNWYVWFNDKPNGILLVIHTEKINCQCARIPSSQSSFGTETKNILKIKSAWQKKIAVPFINLQFANN